MRLPAIRGVVLGAALIAGGLLVTRLIVSRNVAAHPGMTPEELWFSLPAGLKAVVIAAYIMLTVGAWTLFRGLVALVKSIGKREKS